MVALDAAAHSDLEAFGREMQNRQQHAGGLMRSAFAKARGTLFRLSLVIEYMWWFGRSGYDSPPTVISHLGFAGAAKLVADYLMPMAERVYGDAAATAAERRVATLARWILKTGRRRCTSVICSARSSCRAARRRDDPRHVRADGRGRLAIVPKIGFGTERKVAYPVNPLVLGQ
jgi:hypothetical protein